MKDAFLGEVRAGKGFFYNTVVAQAQRIDVAADAITFTFLPTHRALHDQFNETRPWLEAAAERLAGRRIVIAAVQAAVQATVQAAVQAAVQPAVQVAAEAADGGAGTPPASQPKSAGAEPGVPAAPPGFERDLKAEAMSSSAVQAMLDVFPAEISDVEEM